MDCTIIKRIEKMLSPSSSNRPTENALKVMVEMIGNINVKCDGKTLARIAMEDDNYYLLKYLIEKKNVKLDRDDIVYGYSFSNSWVVRLLIDKGIKIPENEYHFIISVRGPEMTKYLVKKQSVPVSVAKSIIRHGDEKLANIIINKTYMKALSNKDRKTIETGFIRRKKIPPGTTTASVHLKKRNRKTLTRLLGKKQLTEHYLTMKGLPRNLVRKIKNLSLLPTE